MFNGNYLQPRLNRAGKATKKLRTSQSDPSVANRRRSDLPSVASSPRPVCIPLSSEPLKEPLPRENAPAANPSDLLQIGSVPLLSREDEIRLAAAIARGDEKARELMIRANLRLVVKIARDYEHLGLPMADLISEGTIGLMKAVDRFEPSKGGKLSTYGSWWIKQQIRRALANQGRTVRLPVHVEGKLYQLGRAEARLRNLLGREATEEELSMELATTPKRIAHLRQASLRPSSLDAPVGDDHSAPAGDLVADEAAPDPAIELERKLDHSRLRELLCQLSEREAKILSLRFGLNGEETQTLEEVGHQFNLTRERIRQVQNEAFRKLRGMLDPVNDLAKAA